jgi:DNA-binding MarR family transcriptional regulator
MAEPADFPAEMRWRRTNISRLLFTAAWLFDKRILDYVNRHGFPGLRMAHLHLPRNIDLVGTRLTELAARAEISKQSMAEIVDACEVMGLVGRISDPEDRRAKQIALTPRGHELMTIVRAAISSAEKQLRSQVGVEAARALKSALIDYVGRGSPAKANSGRAKRISTGRSRKLHATNCA